MQRKLSAGTLSSLVASTMAATLISGCPGRDVNPPVVDAGVETDAGVDPDTDAGVDPDVDAGEPIDTFEIDVWGDVGNVYDFTVSEEQRIKMENDFGGDPGNPFGDQYTLGDGEVSNTTYADNVRVTSKKGFTKDFGQVELRIFGQSTRRPWQQIPNLRLDTDEFQKGVKIDNTEHIRFSNGQVGGIFREAITLRIWRELGYPVPRTTFSWVKSSVWGPDIKVPYTQVEAYKHDWCENQFAGGCFNIWESPGDVFNLPGQCQSGDCDDTRLNEFIGRVQTAPQGAGFQDHVGEYLDWDSYRKFQCLSWFTATGDDYIHNTNNTVVVERDDGKFMFLPYSTDISAGQEWYPVVGLTGFASVAAGCQNDPVCWERLLQTCATVIDQAEALNLPAIVDETYEDLEKEGMLRRGDDERYNFVRAWYEGRPEELRNDPIWTSIPCNDISQCINRQDGNTTCNFEIGSCVAPCGSDDECNPDQICDDFAHFCRFGQRQEAVEFGDRNAPTAVGMPSSFIVNLDSFDEDCVFIQAPQVGTIFMDLYSDFCGIGGSDSVIDIYDTSLNLVTSNDDAFPEYVCSNMQLPVQANDFYIACARGKTEFGYKTMYWNINFAGNDIQPR